MGKFTLFGLTGGIASGKSAVARRWKERGLLVFDADAAAKEVVGKDTTGLREVVETFGSEFLNAERQLDRRKLAAIVFADPVQMKRLENIVWPRINETARAFGTKAEEAGHSVACYEAAIIVERGHAKDYKPLVVVWAPENVRIQRMMKRDGFDETQAKLRLSAQASDAERNREADYLVMTDRPKEETIRVADAVLDHICRCSGVDPERYKTI